MSPNYLPRLMETTPPDAQGNVHLKGDVLAINNNGAAIDANHLLIGDPHLQNIHPPLGPLLPEAHTQPKIIPRLIILHTQAAGGPATNQQAFAFASLAQNVGEAHFYGPQMADALYCQAMPFNVRADSNLAANRFQLPGHQGLNDPWYGAIAIETQDNGGATLNDTPWTLVQIDALVTICTALCFSYLIACTVPTWPLGSGIGQHNLFANDPHYPWSATGHSCPGAARTRQMDVIRNLVAQRLAKIYSDCGESCPGGS